MATMRNSPSNFLLILLCTFIFTLGSAQIIPPGFIPPGSLCVFVNCIQGKCVADNTTLLGFNCDCNSGWKKIEVGNLTLPACVVPNCTVDLQCGNGAPPPPPPSLLPPLPPLTNFTDPCNDLVWCGDGACVVNGTEHICKCNPGSTNLLGNSAGACFKPLCFAADCHGLGFGLQPPPPPTPSSSSSPPRTGAGSKGSNEAPNCLKNIQLLCILLISAILLAWF